MSTVNELIRRSLLLIGEIESDETLTADQSADGLSALQDMLSSWSVDSIKIPYVTTESFTLTVSKQSYTYGTGGDFNSTRPVQIEDVYLRENNQDYPVEIIRQDRYNEIVNKSASGRPAEIYYVPGYPLGLVYLDVASDKAYTLVFDVLKELTNPTAITDSVSFPEGYLRAIRFNLAVELAAEYSIPVKNEVAMIARESKKAIERSNLRVPTMETDFPFISSTFNINTGH